MKNKHAYVTLLDLPECLPFGIIPSQNITNLIEDEQTERRSEEELVKFICKLESYFGEETYYIGEDIIGEKFYKRFLFEQNGFLEVMIGVPVVISAHFTSLERAKKFAFALEQTIETQIQNEKGKIVLLSAIEISENIEDRLTFEKWEKLRDIRADV